MYRVVFYSLNAIGSFSLPILLVSQLPHFDIQSCHCWWFKQLRIVLLTYLI